MLLPRVVSDVLRIEHYENMIIVTETNASSESRRANRRDESCDSILSFALPNDVMFKI